MFLFFLLHLFLSSVFQLYHEEGNFFFLICPFHLTFLCRILFRSVFSHMLKNFFISYVSDHFISILLQHHILKLSKYFCSIFFSVEVSELSDVMLQASHLTQSCDIYKVTNRPCDRVSWLRISNNTDKKRNPTKYTNCK